MKVKLRAWDNKGERMVSWGCMKQTAFNGEGYSLMYDILTGRIDGEIMLYTGVKDKGGYEICEGDLIKNERGRTGKVVWHEFTASFDVKFVSDDNTSLNSSYGFITNMWSRNVEVIGNIYENSELLDKSD